MLTPRFCDPNNNRENTILSCQCTNFSPDPPSQDCYTSEDVNYA